MTNEELRKLSELTVSTDADVLVSIPKWDLLRLVNRVEEWVVWLMFVLGALGGLLAGLGVMR